MAYTADLKSAAFGHKGSSPLGATMKNKTYLIIGSVVAAGLGVLLYIRHKNSTTNANTAINPAYVPNPGAPIAGGTYYGPVTSPGSIIPGNTGNPTTSATIPNTSSNLTPIPNGYAPSPKPTVPLNIAPVQMAAAPNTGISTYTPSAQLNAAKGFLYER